jgi:hypothetical protein
MGLGIGMSGNSAPHYVPQSVCYDDVPTPIQPLKYVNKQGQPTDGNPKANRFGVTRWMEKDNKIVVMLNYPDAINYNGNKILVFDNAEMFWKCVRENDVDPHFLEAHYSPVARFEPTDRGWELAQALVWGGF